MLEDFKHIFTEYGNCFTFNHGENIQEKKKVSVSGRGLNLVFDVHQVSDFVEHSQGLNNLEEAWFQKQQKTE